MKTIILIRHSEPESPSAGQSDINRKLNNKGAGDARKMANHLNTLNIDPGLIISSPAIRALQTAEIFATAFNYGINDIQKEDFIYDGFSDDKFHYMINDINDEHDCVLLFGHNPTLSFLASSLSGEFILNMSTTGTAVIDFYVSSWNEFGKSTGKLRLNLSPSNIR